MENYAVTVEIGPKGYTSKVQAGNHELIADEPQPAGADRGPNPYDFLLTGLGSCTVMTLRMYADRKGWDLQKAVVRLNHEKIHAQDCEDCETREGKIDRIHKEITLEGDLSEEQRQRLMEIADRCPVQQTLISETKITGVSPAP